MCSKLEKWERWLETIKQQLYSIMQSREIYRGTMRAVVNNPAVPQRNVFWRHLQQWYADSLIMGVRRQAKSEKQAISLARLLEEMSANPELLSRAHWKRLFEEHLLESRADAFFDQLAGVGAAHVSADEIRNDLAQLKKIVASCEKFADKRIAHHDRGTPPASPTFDDLNNALDEIARLVHKYYKFVTAKDIATFVPIGSENWRRVLEVPWATSEQPDSDEGSA